MPQGAKVEEEAVGGELVEVEGDLLEFEEAGYIAHQTNCITWGEGSARGLAKVSMLGAE